MRVRLSERGRALCAELSAMLGRHSEALRNRPKLAPLDDLNTKLRSLEGFWTEQMTRPPGVLALGDLAEQYLSAGAGD